MQNIKHQHIGFILIALAAISALMCILNRDIFSPSRQVDYVYDWGRNILIICFINWLAFAGILLALPKK